MKSFNAAPSRRGRRRAAHSGVWRAGFIRANGGFAATEFALIAPVMLLIFFGVVETSDAIMAGRRVTLGVNTLADLVAQETRITKAEATALFTGVEVIMNVEDDASDIRVVSIVYDPVDDRPEVAWSLDDEGGEPYAPGEEFTGPAGAALLDTASSLIVAEADVDYEPTLTRLIVDTIEIRESATRWPRQAAAVTYCEPVSACP